MHPEKYALQSKLIGCPLNNKEKDGNIKWFGKGQAALHIT